MTTQSKHEQNKKATYGMGKQMYNCILETQLSISNCPMGKYNLLCKVLFYMFSRKKKKEITVMTI